MTYLSLPLEILLPLGKTRQCIIKSNKDSSRIKPISCLFDCFRIFMQRKGDFLISEGSAPTKDKVAKVAYCVAFSASWMSFRADGFLIKKKLPKIEVPPDIRNLRKKVSEKLFSEFLWYLAYFRRSNIKCTL